METMLINLTKEQIEFFKKIKKDQGIPIAVQIRRIVDQHIIKNIEK